MNKDTRRAVLFDLDGTLLDTAPDLAGAVNDLRAEAGYDALPLSELAPMCSYGARGMLQAGLDLIPDDTAYRSTYNKFIDYYRARMTRETRPFDGMREVIAQIVDRGWQWGVVTNKTESLALPIMDTMAFDPPPACIVGGDSVAHPKPEPDSILLACERANLDPNQCIYIGDSARDMQAGAAAGMPRIAVGFGYIPAGDDIHIWDSTHVAKTVGEMGEAICTLQNEMDSRDKENA